MQAGGAVDRSADHLISRRPALSPIHSHPHVIDMLMKGVGEGLWLSGCPQPTNRTRMH